MNKKGSNKTMIIVLVVACVLVAGIVALLMINDNTSSNTPDTSTTTKSGSSAEEVTSDSSLSQDTNESEVEPVDNVTAVIDIADYGKITVELDGSAAPITVTNFKELAESGFYNGLTFHRIMEGFMMQGGDPLGNGTGGSDNNIKGEFSSNGVNNPLSHTRGAISMARSQMPDSASSQFFICHEDALFLDGDYACFGYVTDGMDVVDAVCTDAKPIDNNGTIPADEQPVITSITIQ